MKYHQTVYKIINLLKQNNFWFETFEHQPVRTSEEAAKVRTGYILSQGAKAIIVRVKRSPTLRSGHLSLRSFGARNPAPNARLNTIHPTDLRPGHSGAGVKISENEKKFVMLVLPADKKFDNEKVKKLFKTKNIRFATQEEIYQLTDGIKIGGIPPFGNLFDLEVYTDSKLFDNEKIIFNAGDRCFSIAMKSRDYHTLVLPKVVSIT